MYSELSIQFEKFTDMDKYTRFVKDTDLSDSINDDYGYILTYKSDYEKGLFWLIDIILFVLAKIKLDPVISGYLQCTTANEAYEYELDNYYKDFHFDIINGELRCENEVFQSAFVDSERTKQNVRDIESQLLDSDGGADNIYSATQDFKQVS